MSDKVFGMTVLGWPAPPETGFWVENKGTAKTHIHQISVCPETPACGKDLHVRTLCRSNKVTLIRPTDAGDRARKLRAALGAAVNRLVARYEATMCRDCWETAQRLEKRLTVGEEGYPRCSAVDQKTHLRCDLRPGHYGEHVVSAAYAGGKARNFMKTRVK